VYHSDRLMRQPRDLEELLTLSEEHDITLHGQANRRDLSDPDDRFFLRIEVAHACRSSDDTSRRLRDALDDRAREGRPHSSGQRPYGYAPDAVTILEDEAVIIRDIFARYLEGTSPGQIAQGLTERGEVTVSGVPWQPYAVRAVLASRHVTVSGCFGVRRSGKTVEDRITTRRRKTIVRPTIEVLAGLVGPDARTAWDRLADSGQVERLNAVLRFLFAAVIIDEHRAKRGTFDYSRIEIEPNLYRSRTSRVPLTCR
jgi:hypothetical protein